ncbi:hypothetical protein HF086_017584 [Spodoptera exigua]|uniref:Uncharacterized protein n=1 Tax=Spodoptera exigua TaxID=7107 RepID=A0A922MJU2_SPOEX|nr:hypothetical protein HF086_017584 [Spodoptera exigua]
MVQGLSETCSSENLSLGPVCSNRMVDSNWNIGAVLEKKLQPLPFTFALSGMANQAKQQFKFGCGLIIG